MFDALQKRLTSALSKVRGRSRISESDVEAVLGEVRTGLLEGDVHFRVAKDFLARVKDRCLREDVLKSLTPEQQILKVLNDELVTVLGGSNRELNLSAKPPVSILMCGLQGSGKTTTTIKLAQHLKSKGKNPMVVSVDIYRPAAMDQLKSLAQKAEVEIAPASPGEDPRDIAKRALNLANERNFDVLLVDTAGRIQVDDDLMNELDDVRKIVNPVESLLVVDTMMGQQAVDVAEGFDRRIPLTGFVLTKVDGDSRGGAALSLVSVTGKPIKFMGTGERATDFEVFYPDRLASRILDMGDILSLIEKAEQVISQEEASKTAEKMSSGDFSLEDFREQLKMMGRMGSMSGLMKMLPGMGGLKEQLDSVDTEKELKRVNAILNSMTAQERKVPDVLNGSRRARIARGAGVEVSEVNQLIKRFMEAKKMMKQFGKMGNMFKGGNPSASAPTAFRRGGKGFGRKF